MRQQVDPYVLSQLYAVLDYLNSVLDEDDEGDTLSQQDYVRVCEERQRVRRLICAAEDGSTDGDNIAVMLEVIGKYAGRTPRYHHETED